MRKAKYRNKSKVAENEAKPKKTEKYSKRREYEIKCIIQSYMERYGMDKEQAEELVNANFRK